MTNLSLPRIVAHATAMVALLQTASHASLTLQTFEIPSPSGLPQAPWIGLGGPSSSTPAIPTNQYSVTGEWCLQLAAPSGSTIPETSLPAILLGEDPGFCDLWIKPVSRTLVLTPTAQPTELTGVLYIDGAHFLFQRQANRFAILARTLDSSSQPNWLRLGGFAGTPADYEIEDTGGRAKDWLRLTIRRDLAANTYDVWLGGRLVAIDLALNRQSGAAEFRLIHRPTETPADGALAAMLMDDVQASAQHPLYADTDRDAMPDIWESAYESSVQAGVDAITPDRYVDLSTDNDGVLKIVEYFYGSRPNSPDSDADGIPDAVEIQHGLNPGSSLDAVMDKDGDGFSNLSEYQNQGNANISLPPSGSLTNVAYVKADQQGTQNGNYDTPFKTLAAALASPSLTAGGRIVVRGEGGPLLGVGNNALSITRSVTLIGVNMAQISLEYAAQFANVNITGTSASPVFVCENMLFDGGYGDDGGVFRIFGTPSEVIFRACRFSGAYADDDGGAIYAHTARLTLEDCWFNYCMAGGEGGALHAEGDSTLNVRRTHFKNAYSDTDGGALSLRGATTTAARIESCGFQACGAQRGGAVAAVDGADVAIIQSTFTANAAGILGMGGVCFGASTASVVTVSGCILWGNTANGAAQPHLAGGTLTVTYTTLSGWTSGVGPTGTGNNASDPLFRADTLMPTSTAMLDSSDPTQNSTNDFLNNPRWDAPGGTAGTLADRGAFEKQPDSDGDGMSDDWEVRYTLNKFDAADAAADADQDGYANLEEFQAKTNPSDSNSLTAPVVFVNPVSGLDWHPGPNPPAGTVSTSVQGTRSYPFKSIRRAILACANGRRIVLMDGIYAGAVNTALKRSESWNWTPHLASSALTSSLSLDTKTVRGLNGPGRVTLDGGGAARLFDLDLWGGSVAANVTVQNVTLRRGYAGVAVGGIGGAIRATGASGYGLLNITGCVFSGNSATSSGGAIHMTGAGISLSGTTLSANEAPTGGALALVNLTPPGASTNSYATITNSRFAYNLATVTTATNGLGGAISVEASYFSTTNTRFDRNHAARHGGGIALLSATGYYPPSLSTGTIFADNTAAQRGGALYVSNSALTTTNPLFERNIAGTSSTSGEGGAVFVAHPSLATFSSAGYSSRSPEFTGTRFSMNIAGVTGGAVAVTDVSPILTNCAFVENKTTAVTGQGGALSVGWEVPVTGNSTVPSHPPIPKIIHSTFARNMAAIAANVYSKTASAPWLINSLFADGWSTFESESLIGPRQLWGSHLAAPDFFRYAGESDAARRNLQDDVANTVPPSLTFDWTHLATPVRLPTDTTSMTGGVEPSGSVPFIRPSTDIDTESRPATASGKFTLMRGCDEPRDSDNDSLPDWFEKLGWDYSSLDAATGLTNIAPSTTLQLATNSPTNNPDADGYTITQELLYGGRPDAAESEFIGRDSDGDGLSDLYERITPGLDWRSADVNGDDIPDGWAIRYFGTLMVNITADADGDGLSNGAEAGLGLNPIGYDTDGDGVSDAWELGAGTDPHKVDSNGDGFPDVWGLLPPTPYGGSPLGLHQPSNTEPWYVEQARSEFNFDPGSYFYETLNPGSWGIDTMAETSDQLLESRLPIPYLAVPPFPLRYLVNTMDPHTLYRPGHLVNRSLSDITDHHLGIQVPNFIPATVGLGGITSEVAVLWANRIGNESWAAAWFATVDEWQRNLGFGPNQNLSPYIWLPRTVGMARQDWKQFGIVGSLDSQATRTVPTYRLRYPIPGGAPSPITQTFLRFRGRAAAITKNPVDLPPAVSHPLTENEAVMTSVSLTIPQGAQVSNAVTLDPFFASNLATEHPILPNLSNHSTLPYFSLRQFDSLLPVQIESKDRFLNGTFDTNEELFRTSDLEFLGPDGENLGTFRLDGTDGTYIYGSLEEIFSDSESDTVLAGSITGNSKQLSQQVVFWRGPTGSNQIRFSTVFSSLGVVQIRIKKSGTVLGVLSHTLSAEANFGGLLEQMLARMKSLNMPSVAAWAMLPEIDGVDDDGSGIGMSLALMASSAIPAAPAAAMAATDLTGWSRNLLSKLATAADEALSVGELTLKIEGGFLKGYIDGLWEGLKSDITGIADLGVMGWESIIKGDHTRAKAMWDGIQKLAALDKESRSRLFDAMMEKFINKAQVSIPWRYDAGSSADVWGVAAYMSGYSGGFVTEQVLTIMTGFGIVTKPAVAVKTAMSGLKIAQVTSAMVKAVQKFLTGAVLSVVRHVAQYGEVAIRSIRVALADAANWMRNGKTIGEHFAVMMERLGVERITYQQVADRLNDICKTADDWNKIAVPAYVLLGGLSETLGVHLTEKAVRGFLALWKKAMRDGNNGHYLHHLYNVCTVGGTVDAQSMGKILELFDDLATTGYRFTRDVTNAAKWTSPSPASVIYLAGSKEGHRLIHLLSHFIVNPIRTSQGFPHGLFTAIQRADIYKLVDDIILNWNTLIKTQTSPGVWNIRIGGTGGIRPGVIGKADNVPGTKTLDTLNGLTDTEWVTFIHRSGGDIREVLTLYPVHP